MAYSTHTERGDTLVEVLMAIVILSMVIVGTLTIMSRGLAAAQVALEHSQVRLGVNSQMEMLRFARDSYLSNPASPSGLQWSAIVSGSNTNTITYNNSCNVTPSKQGFYLTKNATQVTRTNYTASAPQTIAVPGQGMWVETVASAPAVTPAYVDFVIRACWQGSGSAGQQRTVTAVRLYDPSR